MPKITFISPDGSELSIQVGVGVTLMQAAVDAGLHAIVARCGGACQCASCHVYVAPQWCERLPAIKQEEEVMLDWTVEERRPESRLSCQIEVRPELEGLVVQLPERQT